MIYGLVAPGYEMAEIAAANLTGQARARSPGADLSTKLKLMGVDVASFGDSVRRREGGQAAHLRGPVRGRLQEAALQPRRHAPAGRHPGRRRQPTTARCPMLAQERRAAAAAAGRAARRPKAGAEPTRPPAWRDDAQVCSCNNVSQGRRSARPSASKDLHDARRGQALHEGRHRLRRLHAAGDRPAQGRAEGGRARRSTTHLCEHFALHAARSCSRSSRSRGSRRSTSCSPATARGTAARSASRPSRRSWRACGTRTSSSTTRRSRTPTTASSPTSSAAGLYSVVPRVPGGEITPEKLIVLGEVAKKYGLYTKITGGQRVDLFGAPVHQLPDIWEELVDGRLRERPRLRQGAADGEELRRHDLVPLRRAGLGRLRDPRRESLQGHPRPAQDQGGRLRLHPRVRRGPEQGLRPDRHREGLQPLRLRQRRRQAAARRPARRRPRRGDGHPATSTAS